MACEVLGGAGVLVVQVRVGVGLGREFEHVAVSLVDYVDLVPAGSPVGAVLVPLAVAEID